MARGEGGHEDVQVDGREYVVFDQFVMDFDPVCSQGADVPHVRLICVQESEKGLGFSEFSDLGLVQPLTEFPPHRIEHEFGQLALSWVHGDLGGIETDAFAGVIDVEVGLALFGRVASDGPPARSTYFWKSPVHDCGMFQISCTWRRRFWRARVGRVGL